MNEFIWSVHVCVCMHICVKIKHTPLLIKLAQKPEFNLQSASNIKLINRSDLTPYLRQFTPYQLSISKIRIFISQIPKKEMSFK